MNREKHNKPPSKSKSEREILELQIEVKLNEAKEALHEFNQVELQRIAGDVHEPRFKRIRNWSAFIITVLVLGNIAGWYSVTDRVHSEADRVINQKLVDPQLTNTLNEALTLKAAPFISEKVRPIEAHVESLKTNIEMLTTLLKTATLESSSNQVQLAYQQEAILEQLHPLFEEVSSLQSSVNSAREQAVKLQEEQRLTALMNRGEVFDKQAIAEINSIAQSTNDTASLAQAMLSKLQRTLVVDRSTPSYVVYQEGGDYGGPFTSDELANGLANFPSPSLDGVVNMLGGNKMFVPKLVELAHRSTDLWTINRIAKTLNDMTGVSFYPWDLQPLDSWWENNSINYTNWPFIQYGNGLDAIKSCRYAEALTNFEFVLAMDSGADKSRALAVASAVEVGDMVKAQQLNNNFAIADGRWTQWAQGKMMLATNGIQQGTEILVSLAKKYPSFVQDGYISQGNNILRQVDWTLFSKLMAPTNNTIFPGNK